MEGPPRDSRHGLHLTENTLSYHLPYERYTDHDGWGALLEVPHAVPHTGVGEGLDPTISNRAPKEAEGELDGVFEAVGEGQEGDEDIVVGLEVVSEQVLDRGYSGDDHRMGN